MASTQRTSLPAVWNKLVRHYSETTPHRIRLLDAFLAFAAATGVAQALYCLLVGSFPFNSFLAGFMCAVGCFVLTVSLRLHLAPLGDDDTAMSSRDTGRAFADYVLCNLILFLAVINFIG
jgi:oligosaccharyltransferase complex subunit epsilon